MSTLANSRRLRFTEPEKVLECLNAAGRGTDWKDLPPHLVSCMEELLAAGLADTTLTRRGAKFGPARRVVSLTPEGRARRVAANKAAREAAGAPVTRRW
jgi:DNA-binding PadR family transcriptional regulator